MSSSDIHGFGYGSSHSWKLEGSRQLPYHADYRLKETSYTCIVCDRTFHHYYDVTPDIFAAIEQSGIPDEC